MHNAYLPLQSGMNVSQPLLLHLLFTTQFRLMVDLVFGAEVFWLQSGTIVQRVSRANRSYNAS
jgi:hypothetical protein